MKALRIIVTVLVVAILIGTGASPSLAQGGDQRPAGWDEYSHGNKTKPDYGVVFPQEKVNTITIRISPDKWQAIFDDMTRLYGKFGDGGGMMGGFPGGGQPGGAPPGGGQPADGPGGQPPGGGPGMGFGGILGIEENPIWVPVEMEFEGKTWTNVGFRLKGNSSLRSTWGSGIYKLPFKLDFDQFEDDYPAIKNQRFYGFKKISFSSNWSDDSLLREKVTADIFREAGVPSAQTAFYAVYLDYGQGATYFGLYTGVEAVDDTVIKTQFSKDSGNLYKPEGNGATFAAGTFNKVSFSKETNEDKDDYSDILALYDALHDKTRTSDPAMWRSNLEKIFDADGFVRWMAVNSVVQNWDTYGRMPHNYYLYSDPESKRLVWIPWDNNMALSEGFGGPGGRGRGGPGPFGGSIEIGFEGVGSNWPLIRFLMDDPVYRERYAKYVGETIKGAFDPAKMEVTYKKLHDLIAPYVVGEKGEKAKYTNLISPQAFDIALNTLISHVKARYTAAEKYLAK